MRSSSTFDFSASLSSYLTDLMQEAKNFQQSLSPDQSADELTEHFHLLRKVFTRVKKDYEILEGQKSVNR